MANKLNIKLQEWLDNNEQFKGKFIGYKESRGGLGISRIDNDWHECDDYLIRFEDLLEALADKPSSVPQANELLPHVICPLCGRGITQKMLDAENYVKEYTEENKKPPTYRQVAKHFNIAVNAAHARLRHCRELMRGRANGS